MNARVSKRGTLFRFARHIDPIVISAVSLLLMLLLSALLRDAIDQRLPHTLTIAAGGKTGESFLIGKAIELVVEQHYPNVDIIVQETDGTVANLEALDSGSAQLAMAQADLVSTYARPRTGWRSVAVLFEDTFQLLTCSPRASDFAGFVTLLRDDASQERVHVPSRGGQRESFLRVAEHFGLAEGRHFVFVDEAVDPRMCQPGADLADIVFRVRILGNQEVLRYLEGGWQLLDLGQADAMRLKNSALRPAQIPLGAYRGAAAGGEPIPSRPLESIAVRRVLLADQGVPDWLIHEITVVLNRQSQDLSYRLREYSLRGTVDDPRYIESYVLPLLTNLPSLNGSSDTSLGLSQHPGAEQYYRPNETWFAWANQNADGLGLAVTALTLVGSAVLGANRWMRQRTKDKSDQYIKETAFLKRHSPAVRTTRRLQIAQNPAEQAYIARLSQKRAGYSEALAIERAKLPPDAGQLPADVIDDLIEGLSRLDRLNDIFSEASTALDREEISEESFRTFNEAYKSTRESIENRNEQNRRAVASFYLNQLMKLLDKRRGGWATLDDLDTIRDEATRVLVADIVFSRESFRTFLETYSVVRQALERRSPA
jgi:uncharacterized protein